jgi:hypothetical protein
MSSLYTFWNWIGPDFVSEFLVSVVVSLATWFFVSKNRDNNNDTIYELRPMVYTVYPAMPEEKNLISD